MKSVIIAGQEIGLTLLEKEELRGVYVDALVRFNFYSGEINTRSFILLAHKKSENLRPLQYKQIASRIGKIISLPILFEFDKLESYQRNRFIKQGVHFVVSDKYVFLPFLVINAKDSSSIDTNKLSPIAQYILLRQIQGGEFNALSVREIESITPYKYVTLTRAIRILETLDLCEVVVARDRVKTLQFKPDKELWELAQEYLINPISKIVYCSKADTGVVCSYNALAHYTNLNPDNISYFAIYEKEYKEWSKGCNDLNNYEGEIKIEVWKYPPIEKNSYVDRLSLYLTLKDDKDPRVEKELEYLTQQLW